MVCFVVVHGDDVVVVHGGDCGDCCSVVDDGDADDDGCLVVVDDY